MYVDADTHADETEETWAYIPNDLQYLAPRTISFDDDQVPPWLRRGGASRSGSSRFWFIDGLLFPRRIRDDEETGTTQGTRELTDIALRLRHMDDLDVDVQVLYPTIFISEVTRRPEYELILAKSYNRWISDRCNDSAGRLRWIAVIPFGASPDEAVAEIGFAKEHGAVGIFKRAIQTGRAASDPVFHTAYRAAEEAGLPICIHQSLEWSPMNRPMSPVRLGDSDPLAVPRAFIALVADRIPDKFPNLRWAFIEAGSSWLPHAFDMAGAGAKGRTLADLNCYVANFEHEDIPYLVSKTGGDANFVIGSDYCHSDAASVKDVHQKISSRPDISGDLVLKIAGDNVRQLYGL